MKSIKKGINAFITDLNIIAGVIILIIVYLVGVGVTSIIARAAKKHFLDTDTKKSYWTDLNLKEKPIGEYYKQF